MRPAMISKKVRRLLFDELIEMGADLGQLSILVEDVKCREANMINNEGLKKQIDFLLYYLTPKELKQLAKHEMGMLRKFYMRLQSKTQPEKNIRLTGGKHGKRKRR